MGDYYRGDPGFLSFIGKGLQAVGGIVPGVGGALTTLGEKLATRGAKTGIVRVTEGAGSLAKVTAGVKTVVAKHPVISGLGAAGVIAGAAVAGRRLLKGGRERKHRRMNPCNVRALRRAIRRAHGFERIARRVIRFTSPHKKGRFGGFKKSRKRKC